MMTIDKGGEMKEKEKSNADRMFINLGYKKEKDKFFNYIEYTKKVNKNVELVISFEGNSETVLVIEYEKGLLKASSIGIDMQELQAINEKCKELGWLDE